jgi:beta-alanine degradation protein BauB
MLRSIVSALIGSLSIAVMPAAPAAAAPTPAHAPVPAGAPAAAAATDAVTVGPDIYKTLFENDKVRILAVMFAPGAKIAMHQHPDHAAYVLSSGTLRLTGADGKSSDAALEAGKALFVPKTSHAAVNTTKSPINVIVVEMKPGATAIKAPAGDDPAHAGTIYRELFTNERVRILDATFKPGARIAMHAHPDHAAYVVNGGKLKVTETGKAGAVYDLAAGAGLFVPAQTHSAENVGTTDVKVIVFELR